jgi:hypothetical protein
MKLVILTQMAPSRISTSRVIVFSINTLERRGLIDGDRTGAILVLLLRIFDSRAKSREPVWLPRSNGRLWFGSR